MNFPVLALDAAVGKSYGCLILSDTETLFAESEGSRGHSQTLVPMLEGLLKKADLEWQDLNILALGIGPGSFTGLRIAAAALAGINASLQLPVLSVSSLAITSVQADSEEPLYVLEDARAGEVFVGRYCAGAPVQADHCISWDEFSSVEPCSYTSVTTPPVDLSGWQRLEPALHRGEAMAMLVREAMEREVREGALSNLPIYVQPAYLQISQAERTLRAREQKFDG
ncbi:MAG: tRNA (adenosine(37)-N6)-threonylcarbamoyltransferase complex dimerization subunit type 1 TsaB [Mariprofundaceae bacterium]